MTSSHLRSIVEDIRVRIDMSHLLYPKAKRRSCTPSGTKLCTLFDNLNHLIGFHQNSNDSLVQEALARIQWRLSYGCVSTGTMAIILNLLDGIVLVMEWSESSSMAKLDSYMSARHYVAQEYPKLKVGIYPRLRALFIKRVAIATPVLDL